MLAIGLLLQTPPENLDQASHESAGKGGTGDRAASAQRVIAKR